MIRPLTPEMRAVALTLYSWSLMALLTVMLAAKPHSASRETRGTANMLIRNSLMGRERTGRRTNAIAPHTEIERHGGRRLPVRPRSTSPDFARHPHLAAAGPPGVTKP